MRKKHEKEYEQAQYIKSFTKGLHFVWERLFKTLQDFAKLAQVVWSTSESDCQSGRERNH